MASAVKSKWTGFSEAPRAERFDGVSPVWLARIFQHPYAQRALPVIMHQRPGEKCGLTYRHDLKHPPPRALRGG